jgi:hypothetical protein
MEEAADLYAWVGIGRCIPGGLCSSRERRLLQAGRGQGGGV